jgi:signal transduction histidine kinase
MEPGREEGRRRAGGERPTAELRVRRVRDRALGGASAPEQLPHLFDKFQPTAPSRDEGGTGLGLFIVRTLTEAQRGRVEVASTPGVGSAFTVVLPTHHSLAS